MVPQVKRNVRSILRYWNNDPTKCVRDSCLIKNIWIVSDEIANNEMRPIYEREDVLDKLGFLPKLISTLATQTDRFN